jgi:4'-phosphopantetheinyl transferase
MPAIAHHFFAASETSKLKMLPERERERSFSRCWTRKEAYAKACGDGLSAPLDSFSVTLGPEEPARLVEISGSTSQAAAWTLVDLSPSAEFEAALAYRDAEPPLRMTLLLDPSELNGPW